MRVLVLAVGRMKSVESELAARYLKRAVQSGRSIGIRSIEVVEIKESRAADSERRKLEEAIAIANVITEGTTLVMLDERGESLGSAAFAERIAQWRDGGQSLAFVIGGADGLAENLRTKARATLSFGNATWPHQMVRIMLLEQLYRAVTILSGHPYHRE
jgi:23S rRNA (pseudouridine1915-N3)-methyltransferase